ncbi:hypothetical protein BDD12DRAFT_806013 [Trichophaea hybrida]|nr:hypothetical protein BDD12DRAFT_806013 [Trichophaea hybrida]
MNQHNPPIASDSEPLEDADAIKPLYILRQQNPMIWKPPCRKFPPVMIFWRFSRVLLEIRTATTPGTTTGADFDCIAETIVAGSFGAILGAGVAGFTGMVADIAMGSRLWPGVGVGAFVGAFVVGMAGAAALCRVTGDRERVGAAIGGAFGASMGARIGAGLGAGMSIGIGAGVGAAISSEWDSRGGLPTDVGGNTSERQEKETL